MRIWRNWQTRTVQVRVGNTMQVRLLLSAPKTRLSRQSWEPLIFLENPWFPRGFAFFVLYAQTHSICVQNLKIGSILSDLNGAAPMNFYFFPFFWNPVFSRLPGFSFFGNRLLLLRQELVRTTSDSSFLVALFLRIHSTFRNLMFLFRAYENSLVTDRSRTYYCAGL